MKDALAPWTLDELLELLKAPDPQDRRNATLRLGFFYCNDPSTVEPLIKSLNDTDPGVRGAAAHSLGTVSHIAHVAHIARQAMGRLMALLDDEDDEVIASAIYALGQLGDSSVGPRLLPFLDYPDKANVKVCRVAIEALCHLRYQPAIPHFARLLYTFTSETRNDAMIAVFSMRRGVTDVEKILQPLMDEPDSPLRERVRIMLEIIADEKRVSMTSPTGGLPEA